MSETVEADSGRISPVNQTFGVVKKVNNRDLGSIVDTDEAKAGGDERR